MPILVPFGKGGRVKDDEIESTVAHVFHVFFHVGHITRVLLFRIAVQLKVGLSHGDGTFRGVDGDGASGTALQGCHGEAAGVAEGVEHSLASGKTTHHVAVLALVEEETGLLAFLPVGEVTAVVFQDHFIQPFAEEVAVVDDGVFLAHTLHGFGALVVDGLYTKVGHELESADNLLQMECHAFGLGLHYGCVTVNIDDKARQAVAFRVDEAEAVGMGVIGQTHSTTYLVGLFQSLKEEPFVDIAVIETQDFHGDALRLAEAGAEDVAVVVGDGDGVAGLKAFGGVMDGAREHPRVETFQGLFLAGIEANDGIKRFLRHDVFYFGAKIGKYQIFPNFATDFYFIVHEQQLYHRRSDCRPCQLKDFFGCRRRRKRQNHQDRTTACRQHAVYHAGLRRCACAHRKLHAGAFGVRPSGGLSRHGGHGQRSSRNCQRIRQGRHPLYGQKWKESAVQVLLWCAELCTCHGF